MKSRGFCDAIGEQWMLGSDGSVCSEEYLALLAPISHENA